MARKATKRKISLGGGEQSDSAQKNKKIRFDNEEEDNDDSFIRFAPLDVDADQSDSEVELVAKESLPQRLLTDLPTPWRGHFRSSSLEKNVSSFVQMHNEILEFCSFITPTANEHTSRKALLDEISSIVQSLWPTAQVVVFGSQMTELLTPTSDMDIAVLNVDIPEFEDASYPLAVLASQIKQQMNVSYVEAILNAKVPIVKFDHAPTGISVDVCINNDSGVKTGEILKRYLKEFPALKPLLCGLKVYLVRVFLPFNGSGG